MKIRTIVAVTALAAMALPVAAQHRCCHSVSVPDTVQCTRLQYYIDMQHQNKYTELWGQRATIFEALPVDTNDIVMLGNSLTHGCEWHELLGMPNVLNRGIIDRLYTYTFASDALVCAVDAAYQQLVRPL